MFAERYGPGFVLRCLVVSLLLSVVLLANAATFTVTNANDSGPGSFRQALSDANNNAGVDTIEFNISGAPPFTINLASALPPVNETATIDGTTQPGFINKPVVVLNGTAAASATGLTLNAVGTTVRGLVIRSFAKYGVEMLGGGQHTIQTCFIGTDANGTTAQTNTLGGIYVCSSNNLIGGTGPITRNVISGNSQAGVYLTGTTTRGNHIEGNFIGVDATGTNKLGNGFAGIWVTNAPLNFIGSASAGGGNVIADNFFQGIYIQGTGAISNAILGNLIGTDFTGTKALGNTNGHGVVIDQAPATLVGQAASGVGNLISGNVVGILISGIGASNCVVQGNLIGTDITGTSALGNSGDGVAVMGAAGVLIGGTSAFARNVISGNGSFPLFRPGISLSNSYAATIQGNQIGTKSDGLGALGNFAHGIDLISATNTTIGGATATAGNVIANAVDPVRSGIRLRSGAGNIILGNSIYSNGRLAARQKTLIPD